MSDFAVPATPRACSDTIPGSSVEPLPGTAKQEKAYVLFEWPGGWSRDVLDGDTFGAELTAQLKAKLKGVAGLQLIRRPGRAGRQVGRMHRCYLVWPEQAAMEMILLTGPEKILDLDLTGPGCNGGGVIDMPLVLVCTHGKRDICCAVKGRPLAADLDEVFPGSMVWETSHTKGHRFAPSVLLMPWGYSFGRLNLEAARQMVQAALRGEVFYPANRGRGTLDPRGQVAELAVVRMLADAAEPVRYLELQVETGSGETDNAPVRVTHPDGRAWDVILRQRQVEGVIASCGADAETVPAWVADTVIGVNREDA